MMVSRVRNWTADTSGSVGEMDIQHYIPQAGAEGERPMENDGGTSGVGVGAGVSGGQHGGVAKKEGREWVMAGCGADKMTARREEAGRGERIKRGSVSALPGPCSTSPLGNAKRLVRHFFQEPRRLSGWG